MPLNTDCKASSLEDESGFENDEDNGTITIVDSSPPTSQNERPISIGSASSDQHSVLEGPFGSLVEASPHDDAEDEDIDRAALAEILNEPLDSPISPSSPSSSSLSGEELLEEFPEMPGLPEPVRHEDREDAFDYQNFFLHSALGNFSGTSRASLSSTGSIETTRAGSLSGANISPKTGRFHGRTNSGDSISTAATFATATEGHDSSDGEGYPGDEIDDALFLNGNENILSHSNGYPDSPTRASTGTMSAPSTPRASPRDERYVLNKDGKGARAAGRHVSRKSPSSPSSLILSVVSSLVAAYAPGFSTVHGASTPFSNDDVVLLESLFQSLGKVCSELQISNDDSNLDEKSTDLLRQRLDAARKVLDGQIGI
jgi:hypothetical protein